MRVRLCENVWIDIENRYEKEHDEDTTRYMAFYSSKTSKREIRIPPDVTVFVRTFFNGDVQEKSKNGKGIFMYDRSDYYVRYEGEIKIEFKHAFITVVDGSVVNW